VYDSRFLFRTRSKRTLVNWEETRLNFELITKTRIWFNVYTKAHAEKTDCYYIYIYIRAYSRLTTSDGRCEWKGESFPARHTTFPISRQSTRTHAHACADVKADWKRFENTPNEITSVIVHAPKQVNWSWFLVCRRRPAETNGYDNAAVMIAETRRIRHAPVEVVGRMSSSRIRIILKWSFVRRSCFLARPEIRRLRTVCTRAIIVTTTTTTDVLIIQCSNDAV